MNIQDKPEKFGWVSKLLHHSIALLILFQFLKFFDDWNNKQNFISQMIKPWHGSVGILILFLVVIRIVWALSQLRNRHTEGIAAKFGHLALYLFMVLAPVSAVCLMLGKGYGLKMFSWQIIEKGYTVVELLPFGKMHGDIATILAILVVGHIGMALYHQFIKKEKLLQKMM